MGMIQTKSTKIEGLVEELYEAGIKLRELEKRTKEIKEYIKGYMDGRTVLNVGIFIVILSERSRTDLDREALMKRLDDEYEMFLRSSTYTTLEVKVVK